MRSSAPTTSRASRARPASPRRTPGRSSPAWPARPSGSGWACSCRRSRSAIRACFAKVVTTVDEMSGGRIEVGVGAGWNDVEHRQLGLAFPPIKERADLWRTSSRSSTGCGASPTAGRYEGITGIRIEDALFRPRPVDVPGRPRDARSGGVRPRIIVGGQGSPRSYRLAARYADEFNLSSSSPDQGGRGQRPTSTRRAGRSVATRRRWHARRWPVSWSGGRDAEVEARERTPARGVRRTSSTTARRGSRSDARAGSTARPTRRARSSSGSPTAGLERIMLQDFLPWDLDMVDVMGEELVGRA